MSAEPRWRVGRRLGRTIYLDGLLVGLVDSEHLAQRIVDACNRLEYERNAAVPKASPADEEGEVGGAP